MPRPTIHFLNQDCGGDTSSQIISLLWTSVGNIQFYFHGRLTRLSLLVQVQYTTLQYQMQGLCTFLAGSLVHRASANTPMILCLMSLAYALIPVRTSRQVQCFAVRDRKGRRYTYLCAKIARSRICSWKCNRYSETTENRNNRNDTSSQFLIWRTTSLSIITHLPLLHKSIS